MREGKREREANTHGNLATPGTHSSMSCAGYQRKGEATVKGGGGWEGCMQRTRNRIYNKLNCNNSTSIKNHNSWNSTGCSATAGLVPHPSSEFTPSILLLPRCPSLPLSFCLSLSCPFFWRCIALVVARKL